MIMKDTIDFTTSRQVCLSSKHRRCHSDSRVLLSSEVATQWTNEEVTFSDSKYENLALQFETPKTRRPSRILRHSTSLDCLFDHFHVAVSELEQEQPQEQQQHRGEEDEASVSLQTNDDRRTLDSPSSPDNHWKVVSEIIETDPQLDHHPVSMVVQGKKSACLLVHLLSGITDEIPPPVASTMDQQEQVEGDEVKMSSRTPQSDIVPTTPLPPVPERPEEEESRLEDLLDAIDVSEWGTVSEILERDPHLARHPVSMVIQGENSTCLLVHLLAGLRDTPISVMDQLVTIYPASLLKTESRGRRLPIHIAVLKESHPELIRYLCQARPQALERPDQEGNLPLHYAAMCGSSAEVLHTLLDAYPQACTRANTRDRFPIHLVCARCYDEDDNGSSHRMAPVSTEDLEAIIQAYPAALRQLDRFGRTPLHLACDVLHPQWHLLQLLMEHEPECLLLKDKANKTPLHCARKGKRRGNDLIVTSLQEATNKERRRQHKGLWFMSLHSSSSSSSSSSISQKEHPKDLYCCYG